MSSDTVPVTTPSSTSTSPPDTEVADTAPIGTAAWADVFAAAWVAAWNAHDVDAIVAHYHPDAEYHSPFVAALAGVDHLRGRPAVRAYVAAALERYPDLHFDPPTTVAVGSGSVALVYRSVNDLLAVETLVVDADGLVARAHCHYR